METLITCHAFCKSRELWRQRQSIAMASQAGTALATGKHSDDVDIEDTKEQKQIVSWSNAEILALLDIWADVDIQGQLDRM